MVGRNESSFHPTGKSLCPGKRQVERQEMSFVVCVEVAGVQNVIVDMYIIAEESQLIGRDEIWGCTREDAWVYLVF